MSEKERILNYAEHRFLQEGFYKVSMDEIAADLRISKKTIYKHFPSKEQLVHDMAVGFIERNRLLVQKIADKDCTALQKLVDMFTFLSGLVVKMSPSWLSDINSFMPALWTEIDQYRNVLLRENLRKIVEQGLREGVFISYPAELMIEVFAASVSSIISPRYLTTHTMSYQESMHQVITLLINGILTDRGRQEFNNFNFGALR